MKRNLVSFAVSLVATALVLGLHHPAATPATAAPAEVAASTAAAATPPRTVIEALGQLTVRSETNGGYRRELFVHWIDADHDGCNTRYEVLIAESTTPVRVGDGCWLSGGTWFSAYDGVTTTKVGAVDVDHVVALAEAWRSGAKTWTAARRQAFANDLTPRSLRVVSNTSNEKKSDHDPASWLPARAGFRCEYLADWVATKWRWQLSVDVAEKAAVIRGLTGCGRQPLEPVTRA